MMFKRGADEKILKAFRAEWPDLKSAIDSPNGKVLLSRAKAEASARVRRLGANLKISPTQHIHVNMYFIALSCLEFLSYNSCLRKDKDMLLYTGEQCVSLEGRIKTAVGEKNLPVILGGPLTAKARLIAAISKDAYTLVDGYTDTERLWQSLVVTARAELDKEPPVAAGR
jgi:hypothetical protein